MDGYTYLFLDPGETVKCNLCDREITCKVETTIPDEDIVYLKIVDAFGPLTLPRCYECAKKEMDK